MREKEERNEITGGLLLIGLGILIYTNYWWPGIMYVLGVAIGAGLAFRGRYIPALVTAAIFFGIPLLSERDLPWNLVVPAILVIIGTIVLIRGLTNREEEKGEGKK